jgi:hypothetical protein
MPIRATSLIFVIIDILTRLLVPHDDATASAP